MKQAADGIRAIIQGLEMIADALENYEVAETTTTEVTVEMETEAEAPQEAESAQEVDPPQEAETPPKKRNGKKPKDEPPQITETDVRKLLSAKAQAGFTNEVKALLAKYGTNMISKLEEKDYAAVMEEAEGIK